MKFSNFMVSALPFSSLCSQFCRWLLPLELFSVLWIIISGRILQNKVVFVILRWQIYYIQEVLFILYQRFIFVWHWKYIIVSIAHDVYILYVK